MQDVRAAEDRHGASASSFAGAPHTPATRLHGCCFEVLLPKRWDTSRRRSLLARQGFGDGHESPKSSRLTPRSRVSEEGPRGEGSGRARPGAVPEYRLQPRIFGPLGVKSSLD